MSPKSVKKCISLTLSFFVLTSCTTGFSDSSYFLTPFKQGIKNTIYSKNLFNLPKFKQKPTKFYSICNVVSHICRIKTDEQLLDILYKIQVADVKEYYTFKRIK